MAPSALIFTLKTHLILCTQLMGFWMMHWSNEGFVSGGTKDLAFQHSGWQTINIPISELQATGADLSQVDYPFSLEVYGGSSKHGPLTLRVANIELSAELVIEEPPVLVDSELYSDNFDFEAWLEAGQPVIPAVQSTRTKDGTRALSMQGEYGHAMMMHETSVLTGVSDSGSDYGHHESSASRAANVATSPDGKPSPEVSLMHEVEAALSELSNPTEVWRHFLMSTKSHAYASDYLSCFVDAPEEEDHEEEDHDGDEEHEGDDRHDRETTLDSIVLDDDCSFYSRKFVELKHVVDDTQMFGFERASVIGNWVLSTNLTSNQDVALNPMSEVEVFDDGTAVISETFQLVGEWPIDDEISPTENVIKTEADWILTTDGSLVIAALDGTHTTVLKPMKRVTDGSWR